MKHKKYLLLAFILTAGIAMAMPSCAAKKKAAKAKKEVKAPSKFDQAIEGSSPQEGLFTVYMTKKNKLYFAIPDTAFKREFLLAGRVAATSNAKEIVAGQMNTEPFLIRFSKDNANVYLHAVQDDNVLRPGDPIAPSFHRNFLAPVIKAFPIVDTQGGKALIDVTDFFRTDEKSISPLAIVPPALQARYIRGSLDNGASSVCGVKSYPQNIEIKSILTYTTQPDYTPYTLEMHRSILLLPEKPMRYRLQDNRVGLFSSMRRFFSTNIDKVEHYNIAHRWNLQPKDSAAYLRGELTEPVKPIVFYVDTVFPEKWRPTIHQAVEDWNTAFEAAGFKNAIQARAYPRATENPDFDPDDIRYSCIKYATTATANAMGPSYVDPRSGEIICADVIWYHNVLSLVHNWRLVQTGAVDPRVRKKVFDDDVMCQSLRYVAAHEVGHTIGLMHNMGASYSYPLDSLRSPTFTQRFGTTPSIMDYARNNFVAQPGDLERGVSMTPPILGVYDIHAIRWAYKLIPDAATPEDERPTLNKWITEKGNDPMYTFGAQQFPTTIDPTAQTEDLSNDQFGAGDLSIKNLKILSANIGNWLREDGARYDEIGSAAQEVISQYLRHIGHICPYIGGIEFVENRQGDGKQSYSYTTKEKQQKAIKWLLNEARTLDSWLLTPKQMATFTSGNAEVHNRIRSMIVRTFFDLGALNRIRASEVLAGEGSYKLTDYVNDVVKEVFTRSKAGTKLNAADRDIESKAIELMLLGAGFEETKKPNESGIADDVIALEKTLHREDLPCCFGGAQQHPQSAKDLEQNSFFRPTFMYGAISRSEIAPLWLKALKEVRRIYQSRRTSDPYFDYQIRRIDLALEGRK